LGDLLSGSSPVAALTALDQRTARIPSELNELRMLHRLGRASFQRGSSLAAHSARLSLRTRPMATQSPVAAACQAAEPSSTMTSVSIASDSFGQVLQRDVQPHSRAAAADASAAPAAPAASLHSSVTVAAPFDPTIVAAKQALRARMTRTLNALSAEEVRAQSAALVERVITHPVYKAAPALALFVSMPSGEVQTEALIHHALRAGKKVFVPRIEPPSKAKAAQPVELEARKSSPALAPSGGRMKLLQVHSIEELHSWTPNRWGIREPPLTMPSGAGAGSDAAGAPSSQLRLEGHDCPELQLILCPGVAFDMQRRRLGHGKGYYDTYLASLRSRRSATAAAGAAAAPYTIALAFDEQLLPDGEEVPVGALDIPIDEVLTPSKHVAAASGDA